MNYKKGFTLIELLVVVAIIGILASVVLASLNTARAKGADAAIKANLANTRAAAALYYDIPSNYGTVALAATATNAACSLASTVFDPLASNSINTMVKAAQTAYGATSTALCSYGASGVSWAAYVPLRDTTNGAGFCVDSSGTAKQGAVLSGDKCP